MDNDPREKSYQPKVYSPGDIIYRRNPIAHILKSDQRGKRCGVCIKKPTTSLKLCTGCRFFYYCSKDCHKKDWKHHHKHGECALFNQWKPLAVSDDHLLAIRTYFTLKARPEIDETVSQMTSDGSLGNTKEFKKQNMSKKVALERAKVPILQLQKYSPHFDKKYFVDVFRYVILNSYSFCQDSHGKEFVGKAISMDTQTYVHSCRPNAMMTRGLVQEVRALGHINPGDEIAITHIDNNLNYEKRRLALQEKLIDCKCERCLNHIRDDQMLETLSQLGYEQHSLFIDGCSQTRPVLIETQKRIWSKMCDRIDIRRQLFGKYDEGLSLLCEEWISSYHLMLPETYRSIDVDGDSLIREYSKCIEVTHGVDHNLFKQYQEYVFEIEQERSCW